MPTGPVKVVVCSRIHSSSIEGGGTGLSGRVVDPSSSVIIRIELRLDGIKRLTEVKVGTVGTDLGTPITDQH